MHSIFPTLYKNAHLSSILGGDIRANRLGHAYILEGPKGSGKHTAALLASAAASCYNREDRSRPLPCGECLICRKIREGVSPDVLFFRREEDKATLGVNVIRSLRADLCIAPNENEKKVYIIEDADKMTEEAQNALLLSLESPPPYVLFFLLAENANVLLETVRSRVPVLRMQLFAAQSVSAFLREDPKFAALSRTNPSRFEEAIAASGGAIGQAMNFLSGKDKSTTYIFYREDALRIVPLLFASDPAEALEIIGGLGKKREDALRLIDFTQTALRDMLAVKKDRSPQLLLFANQDECRALAEKVSVLRITQAYKALTDTYNHIAANGSIGAAFTALLMGKRKGSTISL